jgi:hypothetical protein
LRPLQGWAFPISEPLAIFLLDRSAIPEVFSYSEPMPKGLHRYYGNGHLHFLTCSCYHRQPWLATARRRDLFLGILEDVRPRYGFVVVG